MWIVKNTQETALTLGDLGLEIPGKGYVDLDALGRGGAEASRDLLDALQGGQLITIARSDHESEKLLEPRRGSALFEELEDKLKADKDTLVKEIAGIAAQIRESPADRDMSVDTSRIDALLSNFSDTAIAELKNTVAHAERLQQPSPVGDAEIEELVEADEQEEPSGLKSEFEAFRRLLEEFEMLKELLRDEVTGLVSEFRKVKDGKPVPRDEPVQPVRKRPKLTEADFRARAAIIDDIEREIKKNFDNIGSKIKKQKDRTGLVDKLKGL